MSNGRLVSKRPLRRTSYHIGQKPIVDVWYRKRVGWFGKSTALVAAGMLLAFSWGVQTTLLDGASGDYDSVSSLKPAIVSTANTVAVPKLAENIINMQPVLDEWAAKHPDQKWGVSVRSLEGLPIEASLNPDAEFSIDGSYRLYLLLPLFANMNLAKQQQTIVTIDGTPRAVSSCVDLMLRIADNNCATAVSKQVQIAKADSLYKQAGFKHTNFKGTTSAFTTSAGDTAQLLLNLNGSALDASAQNFVVNAMKEQIFTSGIPSACPGCRSASYSGFSGNGIYDAAVITYSQGRYVLAIYTDNGTYADIAKLAGQIQQKIVNTL